MSTEHPTQEQDNTEEEPPQKNSGVEKCTKRGATHSATAKQNNSSKKKISIDLTNCKYKVIKEVAEELDWKIICDPNVTPQQRPVCDMYWHDSFISAEKLASLQPFQRVNHFPAMSGVTRKAHLAESLYRMKQVFWQDYGFYPKTWVLPQHLHQVKAYMKRYTDQGRSVPYLIIKPSDQCQGRGIFLTNEYEKISELFNGNEQIGSRKYVCQRYISKPYLIDGLKFDLRLYVVVTSAAPLTVFWHQEGIARFATEAYKLDSNGQKAMPNCAHLTNYAINKEHTDFKISSQDIQEGTSSKRLLSNVWERLEKENVDVKLVKLRISDMIIKTLLSVQNDLLHNYRMCQPNEKSYSMCYEVLGFDVLIDNHAKPWLLEVNQSPSFATDSEIDKQVKHKVILDTFNMLGLSPDARQKNIERFEQQRVFRHTNKQSSVVQQKTIQIQQLQECLERREFQLDNMGKFWKVFPIETLGENFKYFFGQLSERARDYYLRFDRNSLQLDAFQDSETTAKIIEHREQQKQAPNQNVKSQPDQTQNINVQGKQSQQLTAKSLKEGAQPPNQPINQPEAAKAQQNQKLQNLSTPEQMQPNLNSFSTSFNSTAGKDVVTDKSIRTDPGNGVMLRPKEFTMPGQNQQNNNRIQYNVMSQPFDSYHPISSKISPQTMQETSKNIRVPTPSSNGVLNSQSGVKETPVLSGQTARRASETIAVRQQIGKQTLIQSAAATNNSQLPLQSAQISGSATQDLNNLQWSKRFTVQNSVNPANCLHQQHQKLQTTLNQPSGTQVTGYGDLYRGPDNQQLAALQILPATQTQNQQSQLLQDKQLPKLVSLSGQKFLKTQQATQMQKKIVQQSIIHKGPIKNGQDNNNVLAQQQLSNRMTNNSTTANSNANVTILSNNSNQIAGGTPQQQQAQQQALQTQMAMHATTKIQQQPLQTQSQASNYQPANCFSITAYTTSQHIPQPASANANKNMAQREVNPYHSNQQDNEALFLKKRLPDLHQAGWKHMTQNRKANNSQQYKSTTPTVFSNQKRQATEQSHIKERLMAMLTLNSSQHHQSNNVMKQLGFNNNGVHVSPLSSPKNQNDRNNRGRECVTQLK